MTWVGDNKTHDKTLPLQSCEVAFLPNRIQAISNTAVASGQWDGKVKF